MAPNDPIEGHVEAMLAEATRLHKEALKHLDKPKSDPLPQLREAERLLNDRFDVRSSYYLEEVATQFDIQGLELDWVGICWDTDLRRVDDEWSYHAFRGTRWNQIRNQTNRLYLLNAYRVLLTRARQGIVIFVPEGDPNDHTRPPAFYDGTYNYLMSCGIPEMESEIKNSAIATSAGASFISSSSSFGTHSTAS